MNIIRVLIISIFVSSIISGNAYALNQFPPPPIKEVEKNIKQFILAFINKDIKALVKWKPDTEDYCERKANELPKFDHDEYYNNCIRRGYGYLIDNNEKFTAIESYKILDVMNEGASNEWLVYLEVTYKNNTMRRCDRDSDANISENCFYKKKAIITVRYYKGKPAGEKNIVTKIRYKDEYKVLEEIPTARSSNPELNKRDLNLPENYNKHQDLYFEFGSYD